MNCLTQSSDSFCAVSMAWLISSTVAMGACGIDYLCGFENCIAAYPVGTPLETAFVYQIHMTAEETGKLRLGADEVSYPKGKGKGPQNVTGFRLESGLSD